MISDCQEAYESLSVEGVLIALSHYQEAGQNHRFINAMCEDLGFPAPHLTFVRRVVEYLRTLYANGLITLAPWKLTRAGRTFVTQLTGKDPSDDPTDPTEPEKQVAY